MEPDALDILYDIVWAFYALGPQLIICLGLAYYAARRSGGDLLKWMAGGFLAAVVPIFGIVVMAVLFYRSSRPARSQVP
jgi:hypothetical protein